MSTMIKDAKDIQKARKWGDLFSEDKGLAKKEFREYCKLYHPDVNPSNDAQTLMGIIMEIYSTGGLGTNIGAGTGTGTKSKGRQVFRFTNKVTNKGFELINPVIFSNGICMVYHTATKAAFVYDKSYEKFYKNYIRNVEGLTYIDDKLRNEFSRYFPKIITHFETVTNKYCILLEKTSEVINLGVVYDSYKRRGEMVPYVHAVWMVNRLYNMLCYFKFTNKVFNGLSIYNIWVSPEMHTLLLFSGWEYMRNNGDDMIGCPKDVYSMLPVRIKDTHESSIETDLECVKCLGRKLFEGSLNRHIVEFMDEGTSELDPLSVWGEYGKAVKADYGKRKFVVWEDVPYAVNL